MQETESVKSFSCRNSFVIMRKVILFPQNIQIITAFFIISMFKNILCEENNFMIVVLEMKIWIGRQNVLYLRHNE